MEEIAELAECVADDHFGNSRIEPPTICSRKGISVSYGDYGDAFEGLLEHLRGRFHIYCNTARLTHNSRLRFTVAHELGHYFIVDHRQALQAGLEPHASFSEYQSENTAEREADHFASNLLMPRSRAMAIVRKCTPGLPAAIAVAEQFETSWTSAVLRYVSLDVVSCAIIKWNTDGTAWSWFADSTFRAGYRKLNLNREAVPVDSPTGKALSGADAGSQRFFQGNTVASQWFPFIPQGTQRDVFLIEQAVGLGDYGHITLVFPQTGRFEPPAWARE
jgi:hypothetical protein